MLANNGPASRLLLPQALTRARMCQLLADDTSDINPRSAFMLGLMSMMDLLMAMEMSELMAQLPLSIEIKDAILLREGRLGKLLNLVVAFEHAQLNGRSPELVIKLNKAWIESQKWTNEVMSQVEY